MHTLCVEIMFFGFGYYVGHRTLKRVQTISKGYYNFVEWRVGMNRNYGCNCFLFCGTTYLFLSL